MGPAIALDDSLAMTDVARAERDQYFIACLAFNKALAVTGTA
ncbi:hypothetical protein X754_17605 [Mesorhizobium sp. LNJC403B00]|nr:hypothetical protein X754_17605 [Mesorhizobium sp. LNJC403B00]